MILLPFDNNKLLLFLRGNRGINEEIINLRCFGGEQSDWYEENEDLLLRLDAEERLDGGFRHFVVGVPSFRITIVIYVGRSGDFEEFACACVLLWFEKGR